VSLLGARHADGDRVDIGGATVRLKVNPRAKRIILKVDPLKGEGVAVSPSKRRLGEAVAFARSRRAWLVERLSAILPPVEVLNPAARRDLRREALGAFGERAAVHCGRLGAPVPRLSVTDTRSRWGSCTPARAGRPASIRLSWRLMLAPAEVADYVVAHECAHLIEANHGPRFWALVARLVGDVRPHRSWLSTHGASLHRM
jgi:predicted metal-dependent hydrolase